MKDLQKSINSVVPSGKRVDVSVKPVPGTGGRARVTTIKNPDNGCVVTVVQNSIDDKLNARDTWGNEFHDDTDSPGFLENIFRSLFGLW